MEKLELKHLAGYLPYGIEVLDLYNRKVKVVGLKNETCFIDRGNVYTYGDIYNFRPILRPLSDLTKPITIDGITFVPDTWIYDNIKTDVEIYKFLNGKISLDIETENYNQTIDLMSGYLIIEKLNEWHFDWQGLIDKGLAIDINTLK